MPTNVMAALRMARATPWVASTEIRRLLVAPVIKLLLRIYGLRWGKGWRIYGMPMVQRHGGSRIEVGDDAEMRSWPSSNPLAPNHSVVLATRSPEALLRIGRGVALTASTIVAMERVEIGDGVVIGANATITDTDFHPLLLTDRDTSFLDGQRAPVIIEDGVFIGMNSIILKGVRIGRGAVIGAGSVVTGDVPAGWIYAGNPARPVKEIGAAREEGSKDLALAEPGVSCLRN